MHFIIVGCGRLGANLAHKLSLRGHQVVVLDEDPESFNRLPPDFRGRMVQGEGLGQDVFLRAGAERADGLAAVTDSDAVNAVVGHIARTVYNVPHVVVRNVDPEWLVFHEAFGSQVVSSSDWGARRVEELLVPATVSPVYSVGNGSVEIVQLEVPEPWWGKPWEEVLPRDGLNPLSLTRAGRVGLLAAGTPLEKGDILHLAATATGQEALRARITNQGEA